MSATSLKPTFSDVDSIFTACSDMRLKPPEKLKNYPLFVEQADILVNGYGIRLPGWTKAIVFQRSGQDVRVAHDNWGGRFGDLEQLTAFLKACIKAGIKKAAAEKSAAMNDTGDTMQITISSPEDAADTLNLSFVPNGNVHVNVNVISEQNRSIPEWLIRAVGIVAQPAETGAAVTAA